VNAEPRSPSGKYLSMKADHSTKAGSFFQIGSVGSFKNAVVKMPLAFSKPAGSFPVGYGVTREIADKLGSWWEERRQFIQPSEFVIGADNKIIVSSYNDGPLGRIDAADVVKLIRFYESRK